MDKKAIKIGILCAMSYIILVVLILYKFLPLIAKNHFLSIPALAFWAVILFLLAIIGMSIIMIWKGIQGTNNMKKGRIDEKN